MRFAYADPPYYGVAEKFYGHLHPAAAEYDKIETHARLIQRLCDEFPDGWALHLSTPSLKHILPLCPEKARVCAWVKGFASFKRGVSLHYAWEPVVLLGGRKRTYTHWVRDWIEVPITLRRGFQGAKPEAVVHWVLSMLNAHRESDDIADLFPGSGAVEAAVETWRRQRDLFPVLKEGDPQGRLLV